MRTKIEQEAQDERGDRGQMTRVAIEAREVLARAVQCYEAATSSPEAVNALKAEMLAVTSRCRR
jgi:hypothetical protein